MYIIAYHGCDERRVELEKGIRSSRPAIQGCSVFTHQDEKEIFGLDKPFLSR